jgi:predicted unusual protein kinase regulating ubiquinone biosynthesis (AarF/ABC1/UbiB family)
MNKRVLLLAAAGIAAGLFVRRTVRGKRNLDIAALGVQVGGTYASTAARKLFASTERRVELDRERELRTAEAITERLGNMKGALMKLGQMASYVTEGLPEPMRVALAELQSNAPPMSAELAAGVIERELGAPPEEVFVEWDPIPIASASIGQVHRAVVIDPETGLERAVAVKVQYPGVGAAIEADLRNASLLGAILKQGFGGLDPDDMVAEIRERLIDELDYLLEATNQQTFADFYRGHPFIHVPDVITRLSTQRVLVSEWVDGVGFDDVKALPQAERDRFGEIVYRFCFGSIYHLQHFNADAHPGNYLLMEDGRVAFLDFGMTKHLDEDQIELEIAALAAAFDDDPERLRVALHDLGFLNDPRKVDAELLMEHVRAIGGWYMEDREVTIDSARVMEAITAVSDPRSSFYRLMRRENLPANELMGRRMESGVLAVLGQLNATRNWFRIGSEWWFAGEPATELGREEWAYFESRGGTRARRAAAR